MASTAFLQSALPASLRDAFSRRLVRFHLDELNGFADQLRYLASQGGANAAADAARVRQRCLTTLEALAWNSAEVIRWTWDWLERARPAEEDHFAPALVLTRLGADSPQRQAWLQRVSPEVLALVSEVLG
jgi:hypothetical protein